MYTCNADDGQLKKCNRNRNIKAVVRPQWMMYIQPDYPPHSEMQKSRFKFFRVAPPALKNPWRSTCTCAPDTNCGLSCMPSCGKTYPTLVRFAKRLNCRKFPAVLFFKNHLNARVQTRDCADKDLPARHAARSRSLACFVILVSIGPALKYWR